MVDGAQVVDIDALRVKINRSQFARLLWMVPTLIGVTLLISVPVTLLGFVTPFAIRLLVRDLASTGTTSGRLYALSTVGSIVGSFLPVIILIPLVGTARTFLLMALAQAWFLAPAGRQIDLVT